MEKYFPKLGEHLYLYQPSGGYYIQAIKNPYTVVAVSSTCVMVQAARPVFNGPRYYDTLADDIVEDPEGEILKLHWASKKARWQIDKYQTGHPRVAVFGKWEYFPYLD